MDKTIGGSGGGKPARRFAFSWADEVEREEQQLQQQQQNEQSPRREDNRERTKTDPFGAARPREVVLAEKGIDWRDRDRELEVPHSSTNCGTRVQEKRHARAALEPMTTTRRQHAASTPTAHPKIDALPITCSSAWGGERKCAVEAPVRGQVQSLAYQGRTVLGELNSGSCRNASPWISSKSARTEETEVGKIAAADGENRGRSRVPVMARTVSDESGVDRKRTRHGGKGRGRRWDRRGPRSSNICSSRYHNCTDS